MLKQWTGKQPRRAVLALGLLVALGVMSGCGGGGGSDDFNPYAGTYSGNINDVPTAGSTGTLSITVQGNNQTTGNLSLAYPNGRTTSGGLVGETNETTGFYNLTGNIFDPNGTQVPITITGTLNRNGASTYTINSFGGQTFTGTLTNTGPGPGPGPGPDPDPNTPGCEGGSVTGNVSNGDNFSLTKAIGYYGTQAGSGFSTFGVGAVTCPVSTGGGRNVTVRASLISRTAIVAGQSYSIAPFEDRTNTEWKAVAYYTETTHNQQGTTLTSRSWVSNGGSIVVDSVVGRTVNFRIIGAVMVPDPNAQVIGPNPPTGTFTMNVEGRVDNTTNPP